mgnify:CR=1 FL=1
MTPRLEYGEMVISTAENDYLFRPSLDAMTRIGAPKDVVSAFTRLNGVEVQQIIASAVGAYGVVPEWLIALLNKPVYGRSILSTAMDVMQACCNDDCSVLRLSVNGGLANPAWCTGAALCIIAISSCWRAS